MVKIQANANFYSAPGTSVFEIRKKDKKFLQYRKSWYDNPANFTVAKFPLHLDIETTNICNLRCPFCATTYKKWGPSQGGFIDLGLFKRIIDEGAKSGLYSIKLSLRGEPLLHSEIAKMIKYARNKGIIDIYFNTNAMLLSKDMINDLLDAGLFRISISLEGTTQDVYEKYRVGANFEKVLNNIKNLKKSRDERQLSFPQIRIQTVLLDELKDSFSAYVKFWKKVAEEVSFLDARKETPGGSPDERIVDWACPFLWQRMSILWDGTLLPCLMHGVDDLDSMSLGNVKKVSIKKMWDNAQLNEFRKLHKQGLSHKLKACRECSYRAMEIDKLCQNPNNI